MASALTKAKIEKFFQAGVPAGKSESVLWDGVVTGLGLRLRASGGTSWVFLYRPRGAGRRVSSRRVTLGSFPTLSLDAARTAARAKAGEIALGIDPAVVLRAERDRERKLTSRALDDYEQSLQRRHIVNTRQIMSTLRRNLTPLMAREIDTLNRRDLVGRIEALEAANLPGAARDLRQHCRSMLEWAVAKGLIVFNPLSGLRRPRQSRAERLGESKGKALDDMEILALWTAAGRLGAFGRLSQFAIVSGLRRSELAGLRWSSIGSDRVEIPAHGTKTGQDHAIPLTQLMREVLAVQPKTTSDLIFPSPRTGRRMSGWAALVASAVKLSSTQFKLHDLRRTFRTLLSKLGVDEATAELCIGHTRKGLVAIYNRDDMWNARVKAFATVSRYVDELVSGGAGKLDEAPERRVIALRH